MLSLCSLEKKTISLCVCLAHLQPPCIEEQNLSFLFSFSGVFEWVNTEKFWFSHLINFFCQAHSSFSRCRSCSTAQKRQARPAFAASSGSQFCFKFDFFFNFLLKSTGFLYSTPTFFLFSYLHSLFSPQKVGGGAESKKYEIQIKTTKRRFNWKLLKRMKNFEERWLIWMYFLFSTNRVVPLTRAPLRIDTSIATDRKVNYLQKFHSKYESEIKMMCLNDNY